MFNITLHIKILYPKVFGTYLEEYVYPHFNDITQADYTQIFYM